VVLSALIKLNNLYPLPENAQILYCDAGELLVLLNETKVDKIYLNFSDPWPKLRHHKRRLTSLDKLQLYHQILSDDGIIELRTDNYDFYLESLKIFNECQLYDIINQGIAPMREILSEYEIKFRRQNLAIYHIIAERKK
jgi:tRNA (guanine-N7-)-methyltransferase